MHHEPHTRLNRVSIIVPPRYNHHLLSTYVDPSLGLAKGKTKTKGNIPALVDNQKLKPITLALHTFSLIHTSWGEHSTTQPV